MAKDEWQHIKTITDGEDLKLMDLTFGTVNGRTPEKEYKSKTHYTGKTSHAQFMR